MIKMNWTRFSVQARSAPIPQLEGENVRSGADFQDHAVAAGTVNSSRRNQKVVMPPGGPLVHIFIGIKPGSILLRMVELPSHLFPVYIRLDAQIDTGIGRSIQEVVALVLSVSNAKLFLDVFGQRMNLQRQISPVHRVQEIEAYGEFRAESLMHSVTQKLARMLKHQIDCRNFDHHTPKLEPEGVLFGDAIKAPGIVWRFGIQATDFPHPLPSPWAWIEERNHPKRPGRSHSESGAESIAGNHLRRVGVCRIEQKIYLTQQLFLDAVRHSPIEEVAPLVAQTS